MFLLFCFAILPTPPNLVWLDPLTTGTQAELVALDPAVSVEVQSLSMLLVDHNTNGRLDPGDVLRTLTTVTNLKRSQAEEVVLFWRDEPGFQMLKPSRQGPGTWDHSDPTVTRLWLPPLAGSARSQILFDTHYLPKRRNFTRVSLQGRVLANGIAEIATDDPDTLAVDDPTVTALADQAVIRMTKRDSLANDQNGNGGFDPGDTIRYTIEARNVGTLTASGLELRIPDSPHTSLVAGSPTASQGSVQTIGGTLTFLLGAIAPGETLSASLEVTIDQPLPSGVTSIACQGLWVSQDKAIQGVTDDPDTPLADDPTLTPLGDRPFLVASKRDSLFLDQNGDGLVSPGDVIRYTIEASNQGSLAAPASSALASPIPDHTQLQIGSVTTTAGQVTSGNQAGDDLMRVLVGAMEPGAMATITFDVLVDRIPPDVEKLFCQGRWEGINNQGLPLTDDPDEPGDQDPTLTTAAFEGILVATKTDQLLDDRDGDGRADPGDALRYVVEVRNDGNGALNNAAFETGIDSFTLLIDGSITTSQGTIVTGGTSGTIRTTLGNLAPSARATITFDVRINEDIPPGTIQIRCQGLVTADNVLPRQTDDPDTPAPDDPTLTPLGPFPLLEATLRDELANDLNGDGQAGFGDRLRYTLVVENLGNEDATTLTIATPIDPNTRLVPGSVSTGSGTVISGSGANDSSVEIAIDSLGAGEQVTITFDVLIETPAVQAAMVRVQGEVHLVGVLVLRSDDPDTSAPDDPTDTPVVDTLSGPLLVATKTSELIEDFDDNGMVSPGDHLLYVIQLQPLRDPVKQTQLTDRPDGNTSLIRGSIQVSQGQARVDQDTITWDAGQVAVAGASLQFRVAIAMDIPPDVRTVSNQASVTAPNMVTVLSDDPRTAEPNDPTVDWLVDTRVPTLSEWGLGALVTGLGGTALWLRAGRGVS